VATRAGEKATKPFPRQPTASPHTSSVDNSNNGDSDDGNDKDNDRDKQQQPSTNKYNNVPLPSRITPPRRASHPYSFTHARTHARTHRRRHTVDKIHTLE
jgi:hypothetical protein